MNNIKDIDDLIKEIEAEPTPKVEVPVTVKTKEVDEIESQIPDVTENEELMRSIFKMTLEDRKKADDAYEIFAPEISTGQDKTTASKEAMMKAIELKITSARNIIDMMKLNKKDQPAVGVFMGNFMSERKAGINLKNLSDEIND